MNLFLAGWNVPANERARLAAQLRGMTSTFPLLDPTTHDTFSRGCLFATYMHGPEAAARPRRYVAAATQRLTLFDGCPVAPSGSLFAHDAVDLERHWSDLHEQLEGQFAALRLDEAEGTLELLTDPLGLRHVFVAAVSDRWYVSNSVQLLAEAGLAGDLDLVAAGHFLAAGWIPGDRTLLENVRVVPAGQRWSWRVGNDGPARRTYFDVAELARDRPRSPLNVTRTAGEMGLLLQTLGRHFGTLRCPITAGRDSRMMVGLMLREGIPGNYFTNGHRDSDDVRIAGRIARSFDLPHMHNPPADDEVTRAWGSASHRLLRQNDGMVTLAHVRNAVSEPPRLHRQGVHLYGAGGALARGKMSGERLFLAPPTPSRVTRLLVRKARGANPLIREEVAHQVERRVSRIAEGLLASGVRPIDLPDAFLASEHERRWAGSQFRQVMSRSDVFSPFLTRPYARAAFSVPALDRYTEVVPRRLLAHLSRGLHELPYGKPWLPASPTGFYLWHVPAKISGRLRERVPRAARPRAWMRPGRKRDRTLLLEEVLPHVRERCLSRDASSLWELIDRGRLERLLDPSRPTEVRARHHAAIYLVATLFSYEAELSTVRTPHG